MNYDIEEIAVSSITVQPAKNHYECEISFDIHDDEVKDLVIKAFDILQKRDQYFIAEYIVDELSTSDQEDLLEYLKSKLE